MKHKSRLLEAVHETARDLKELGFIDKRALNRYDVLCIEPVPSYSPEQIRTLRDRYRNQPGGDGFHLQYKPVSNPEMGNWREAPRRAIFEAIEHS